MSIPVANVYYLLCYAWDLLDEGDPARVAAEPETRLVDLFARVLAGGVAHVLRRGIDRTYAPVHNEIAGVRGRLDLAASLKRASLARARAWCTYDERTPDVLHNRVLRTTLRSLARADDLDAGLAEQLRALYRRMDGVGEVALSGRVFAQITLGRNTRHYRLPLDVCELVFHNLLVDERSGRVTFRDFTRDDRQMARVFERFVRNFYTREQRTLTVRAPALRWQAHGSPEALAYVPGMQTDVVLANRERTIVLDTKYYASTLQQRSDRASIHSENLYQLFSYLMNYPRADHVPEGVLLYPRTTRGVTLRFRLHEFPVSVRTVDLSRPWPEVHAELIDAVA